jgi:CHAT domain-containing protein
MFKWLRNFAGQLAQAMGLGAGAEATGATGTEDAAQFLLETLQLVADSDGDPTQIYPVWAQQQGRLNGAVLAVLPAMVAQLYENLEQRTSTAAVLVTFGDGIQQFPLGDRSLNLELGIAAYEQALQVYTRDAFPQGWARTQHNLAAAYSNRIKGDRAESIERAIAAYEQALQVYTRAAFPQDWAMTQNNLALAYSDRIKGDRAESIERAIAAYEQALQVFTRDAFPQGWAMTQNNLANAYSDRIKGDRAESIERAISAYEQALQVFTRDAFPKDCRRTSRLLANLHADLGDWAAALPAYTTALAAAETLYQSCLLLDSQAAELQDTADLPRRAAYAYAKTGDLSTAVLTLEANRARGLSASLDRDRANLTQLQQTSPNLYAQYQALTQQLRTLESQQRDHAVTGDRHSLTPKVHRHTAIDLRQSLDALITQIRQVEGYANFLDQPSFADICAALQPNHPLVYLVPTPAGSLALVIRSASPKAGSPLAPLKKGGTGTSSSEVPLLKGDSGESPDSNAAEVIRSASSPKAGSPLAPLQKGGTGTSSSEVPLLKGDLGGSPASNAAEITPIWLNDLTETSLIDLLINTWFKAYDQSQSDRQGWFDAIAHGTQQLWAPLMAPLIDHLKTHHCQQATLIPTGPLSLLPLHAAWTEDASSQPSGKRYALDDIHFTYAPNARSLTAAQKIAQQVQSERILAIDNPRQDLPNSAREVNGAIAHFPEPTVLRHTEATVEAVRSQLIEAAIVHFSCHGTANFTQPLNSGLRMSDGLLTLRDLFALKLTEGNASGIRLAILSACETGLPGLDNIDEVVSLPIGLLQAGVAGVVASLWSVSDLSTMILLTRFYDLWRKDGLEPAIALRQAQQWLRDASPTAIVAHCATFIPDLDQQPELKRSLKLDYSHPFHWSAFSYTGV